MPLPPLRLRVLASRRALRPVVRQRARLLQPLSLAACIISSSTTLRAMADITSFRSLHSQLVRHMRTLDARRKRFACSSRLAREDSSSAASATLSASRPSAPHSLPLHSSFSHSSLLVLCLFCSLSDRSERIGQEQRAGCDRIRAGRALSAQRARSRPQGSHSQEAGGDDRRC